jgi:hypothetical protein
MCHHAQIRLHFFRRRRLIIAGPLKLVNPNDAEK